MDAPIAVSIIQTESASARFAANVPRSMPQRKRKRLISAFLANPRKRTIQPNPLNESKPIEIRPMRFRTSPNANRKRNRMQSPLGSVPPAANIPTAIRSNPRRKTAAA